MRARHLLTLAVVSVAALSGCSTPSSPPQLPERLLQEQAAAKVDIYVVDHQDVQSTVFQVGRIYDPAAGDQGQSMSSAWDAHWSEHYGGCDGVGPAGQGCDLDVRTAANGYFPTAMTPRQNPFYVALPLDDTAPDFTEVMPWDSKDGQSALHNRWVKVVGASGTCYGQVEDDGPSTHSDANYVLRGAVPYQPGPAIALSPALSACVGTANGTVDWSFVAQPPTGSWTKLVTH